MSEKLPEEYIKGPKTLLRAAGQLALMWTLEKADVLAAKVDEKLARYMDLGDE